MFSFSIRANIGHHFAEAISKEKVGGGKLKVGGFGERSCLPAKAGMTRIFYDFHGCFWNVRCPDTSEDVMMYDVGGWKLEVGGWRNVIPTIGGILCLIYAEDDNVPPFGKRLC